MWLPLAASCVSVVIFLCAFIPWHEGTDDNLVRSSVFVAEWLSEGPFTLKRLSTDHSRLTRPCSDSLVLFVPGHAGSWKQVIPLSEWTKKMAGTDFFAVDFNAEPTALHHSFLAPQARFVRESLAHILQACGERGGKSRVVVLAHSMGGLVSLRALSDSPDEALLDGASMPLAAPLLESVSAFVCLACPLSGAPGLLDPQMAAWYHETLTKLWNYRQTAKTPKAGRGRDLPPFLSVASGFRDHLVPPPFTKIPRELSSVFHCHWMEFPHLPGIGRSTSHISSLHTRPSLLFLSSLLSRLSGGEKGKAKSAQAWPGWKKEEESALDDSDRGEGARREGFRGYSEMFELKSDEWIGRMIDSQCPPVDEDGEAEEFENTSPFAEGGRASSCVSTVAGGRGALRLSFPASNVRKSAEENEEREGGRRRSVMVSIPSELWEEGTKMGREAEDGEAGAIVSVVISAPPYSLETARRLSPFRVAVDEKRIRNDFVEFEKLHCVHGGTEGEGEGRKHGQKQKQKADRLAVQIEVIARVCWSKKKKTRDDDRTCANSLLSPVQSSPVFPSKFCLWKWRLSGNSLPLPRSADVSSVSLLVSVTGEGCDAEQPVSGWLRVDREKEGGGSGGNSKGIDAEGGEWEWSETEGDPFSFDDDELAEAIQAKRMSAERTRGGRLGLVMSLSFWLRALVGPVTLVQEEDDKTGGRLGRDRGGSLVPSFHVPIDVAWAPLMPLDAGVRLQKWAVGSGRKKASTQPDPPPVISLLSYIEGVSKSTLLENMGGSSSGSAGVTEWVSLSEEALVSVCSLKGAVVRSRGLNELRGLAWSASDTRDIGRGGEGTWKADGGFKAACKGEEKRECEARKRNAIRELSLFLKWSDVWRLMLSGWKAIREGPLLFLLPVPGLGLGRASGEANSVGCAVRVPFTTGREGGGQRGGTGLTEVPQLKFDLIADPMSRPEVVVRAAPLAAASALGRLFWQALFVGLCCCIALVAVLESPPQSSRSSASHGGTGQGDQHDGISCALSSVQSRRPVLCIWALTASVAFVLLHRWAKDDFGDGGLLVSVARWLLAADHPFRVSDKFGLASGWPPSVDSVLFLMLLLLTSSFATETLVCLPLRFVQCFVWIRKCLRSRQTKRDDQKKSESMEDKERDSELIPEDAKGRDSKEETEALLIRASTPSPSSGGSFDFLFLFSSLFLSVLSPSLLALFLALQHSVGLFEFMSSPTNLLSLLPRDGKMRECTEEDSGTGTGLGVGALEDCDVRVESPREDLRGRETGGMRRRRGGGGGDEGDGVNLSGDADRQPAESTDEASRNSTNGSKMKTSGKKQRREGRGRAVSGDGDDAIPREGPQSRGPSPFPSESMPPDPRDLQAALALRLSAVCLLSWATALVRIPALLAVLRRLIGVGAEIRRSGPHRLSNALSSALMADSPWEGGGRPSGEALVPSVCLLVGAVALSGGKRWRKGSDVEIPGRETQRGISKRMSSNLFGILEEWRVVTAVLVSVLGPAFVGACPWRIPMILPLLVVLVS